MRRFVDEFVDDFQFGGFDYFIIVILFFEISLPMLLFNQILCSKSFLFINISILLSLKNTSGFTRIVFGSFAKIRPFKSHLVTAILKPEDRYLESCNQCCMKIYHAEFHLLKYNKINQYI